MQDGWRHSVLDVQSYFRCDVHQLVSPSNHVGAELHQIKLRLVSQLLLRFKEEDSEKSGWIGMMRKVADLEIRLDTKRREYSKTQVFFVTAVRFLSQFTQQSDCCTTDIVSMSHESMLLRKDIFSPAIVFAAWPWPGPDGPPSMTMCLSEDKPADTARRKRRTFNRAELTKHWNLAAKVQKMGGGGKRQEPGINWQENIKNWWHISSSSFSVQYWSVIHFC